MIFERSILNHPQKLLCSKVRESRENRLFGAIVKNQNRFKNLGQKCVEGTPGC